MRKILIIDDDPRTQNLLKIIFVRAGYSVAIESNPQNLICDNYPLPDIFLLDMSEMDGLDICRHIKNSNYSKHLPLIMMSGDPDINKLSFAAGAEGFIEKPFNVVELLNLTEKFVKKYVVYPWPNH